MKIVEGRYYRTRDGQKVGPMALNPNPGRDQHDYWQAPGALSDGSRAYWFSDGCYWPEGDIRRTAANADFDLIAEWSDPVALTAITTPDYNDGKWHGWNGGECPVDPASVIDVHYINAFGGYGRDEDRLASQHSWALSCLFRVTKPAPPKPRTIYLCEVHGTRTVFDTAIAATREALEYQHGEATVTEWREVMK